jgi:creatinine amidohydrolase/Fe(II)-dependent formamide hydrolase-like protein
MRVHDMNWMQVEEYLRSDDRVVLPLGSTEQHGHLSLGVDVILSERVSAEAAEPLGVPVMPSLPYGLTPYFAAYPGSPSLRVGTYVAVVRDLLDSLYGQGFRRQLARGRTRARVHGRPARRAGHLPQLVERAANLGGRAVDRLGREPRLMA